MDEILALFSADPATARRITYEKINDQWYEVSTRGHGAMRHERRLRPYEKLRLGIVAGENATL